MLREETKSKYGIGTTLGFMLKVAWQQRPTLYLIYFVQLLADCMQKAQYILLPKFLMDELALLLSGEAAGQHLKNALCYAGLTVGLLLLSNLMLSLVNWRKEPHRVWLDHFFEETLAGHTMSMDFEHTEDPEALNQVAKAKDGINWYSGGVIGILDQFYSTLMNGMVLVGVVTVIAVNCPLLLPVQLLALLFITWLNARNNKIEIEDFAKLSTLNRIFGYIFWSLVHPMYGKDIRLYDSADMMKEKGSVESEKMVGVWAGTARKQRKNSWGMDSINSFRDGISYFYIGYLAIKGVLTLGDFSMCISAASTLYWSLFHIVQGAQEITKRCNYAADFLKFLDYPAAMPKGTKETKQGEHVIEFCNVSFRYPRSENFVLRNINLTIRSGEHLSIVGLNGAGKTTLIKLLCRLYDVTEGEIKIDGINIKEYSDEAYRKLFAVVFQDFKLFAFSLKENIVLGKQEDEAKVEEVLRLSGLYEDAMKLEHGLNTTLYKSFDEQGTELSGGQQQKVAISRALYHNAPIVILDEPTAALDPVAEYEIYKKFDSLVGGKTAIYISHRLSSCKFCDHIAVFAEDTIKEYGTHDSLVHKKDGIYAEMFAAQAQYYVENTTEAAVAII